MPYNDDPNARVWQENAELRRQLAAETARAERAEFALAKIGDMTWLDSYGHDRRADELLRHILGADDTEAAGRIGAMVKIEQQLVAERAARRKVEAVIAEVLDARRHHVVDSKTDDGRAVEGADFVAYAEKRIAERGGGR